MTGWTATPSPTGKCGNERSPHVRKHLLQRFASVQAELKAPKARTNKFGGYKYRSCEDILKAAKPLLKKHSLVLTMTDTIQEANGRFYVVATAIVSDTEGLHTIQATACAREAEAKKGMDDSQITGTASSYARKYALNGLFCLDDVTDADSASRRRRTSSLRSSPARTVNTTFCPITTAKGVILLPRSRP